MDRAAGEDDVTRGLAAWGAGLSYADLPERVREAARLLTLDGLGCGLLGATTGWGRIVADFVRDSAAGPEATVWGSRPLVPAARAPLANGTFVHSFEFDDVHPQAVLHGAAQVVPAALAVAELRTHGPAGGARAVWLPGSPPSPPELLTAIVAGLEVGARIGLATGAAQLRRGFHPSPNTGTFAAAMTAGRLLGLGEEQLTHAFGIAGSCGGALMAAQYGAMVKRVHAGRAAQAGVESALLAARGLTGTSAVLEAPYGGFAHAYTGEADAEAGLRAAVAGLGTQWETPNFAIKAYPCCGSSHTAVDAFRSVRDEAPDLTADRLASIDVACSTLSYHHVGWDYRPGSVTTAQMNLPYTLAVLAVDGELFVDQFAPGRVGDPAVVELAARVNTRPDEAIDRLGRDGRHVVRVTVTARDGRRFEREVRHARGTPHSPLSRDEIVDKYRAQAGRVLDAAAVADLERHVATLGDDEDQKVTTAISEALRSTSPDHA